MGQNLWRIFENLSLDEIRLKEESTIQNRYRMGWWGGEAGPRGALDWEEWAETGGTWSGVVVKASWRWAVSSTFQVIAAMWEAGQHPRWWVKPTRNEEPLCPGLQLSHWSQENTEHHERNYIYITFYEKDIPRYIINRVTKRRLWNV